MIALCILAMIGGLTVLGLVVLVIWIGLQLTTDDDMRALRRWMK